MVDLTTPIKTHPLGYSLKDMGSMTHTPGHPLAGEPLVKLDDYAIACKPYTQRKVLIAEADPPLCTNHDTKSIWVRQTVAEMLAAVHKLLVPEGLEVYIKSGYRPMEVQQEFWAYFISQAEMELKDARKAEIISHAEKFCANPENFDPENPQTWSPHFTGGAVDLTLRNKESKKELDMDPPGYSEQCYTHFTENLPPEKQTQSWYNRRENRRVLFNAMTAAGFTNYPHEWWHYDYGTPLYALEKPDTQGKFFYGVVPHPER